MGSASIAHGTTFKLNAVTISEIVNISAPKVTAAALNASSHSSPNNYMEFIQGMRDGGEMKIEGNLVSDHVAQLSDLMNTSSLVSAIITAPTVPSSTRWTANVFVTSFGTEHPNEGLNTMECIVKVAGKPVFEKV